MTTQPPQELPELPEATYTITELVGCLDKAEPIEKAAFTADQMREYGRAYIAASQATAEPLAWFRVENGMRVYYESNCWPDLTPLYANPPLEAQDHDPDATKKVSEVREAMSAEQVSKVYKKCYPEAWMADGSLWKFACEIQAFHSIGTDKGVG